MTARRWGTINFAARLAIRILSSKSPIRIKNLARFVEILKNLARECWTKAGRIVESFAQCLVLRVSTHLLPPEASCGEMADSSEKPPSSGCRLQSTACQPNDRPRMRAALYRVSDWMCLPLSVSLWRFDRRHEPLKDLRLSPTIGSSSSLTLLVARASYRDWLATIIRTGRLLKKQFQPRFTRR